MKRTATVHAKDDPIHEVYTSDLGTRFTYVERADVKEVYVNVYTIEGEELDKQYGVLCTDQETAAYLRFDPLGSKCVYRLRIKSKSGKNKRKVK